jgi:hypothetical protein
MYRYLFVFLPLDSFRCLFLLLIALLFPSFTVFSLYIGMQIVTLFLVVLIYWYVRLKQLNSMALVRKRTILTWRPPLVGNVSANFYG